MKQKELPKISFLEELQYDQQNPEDIFGPNFESKFYSFKLCTTIALVS